MEYLNKPAPILDYRTEFEFEMIQSLESLQKIFIDTRPFSFDTETTGLNPLESKIAGFSLSFDGVVGYYIPIAHVNGGNAPRECLDFIVEQIKISKGVYMYNKKFDLNMLEIAEGYDVGPCLNVYDVMGFVWLYDTDVKMPSLKRSSEHFLGIIQPKYDETVGSLTFDYAEIWDVLEYAALDAICTFKLVQYMSGRNAESKAIFKIDNLAIEAIRCMEHTPVLVNKEWLLEERDRSMNRIHELKKKIVDICGYEFNPDSNKQKADALLSAGIRLTAKTDKGSWKVDLENLEKLEHPLPNALAAYSREIKYYGSYVNKLLTEIETKKDIRFNYHLFSVPTGRLACGGDKKNSYYAHYNIQSMPKSKQIDVAVVKTDENAIGWKIVEFDEPAFQEIIDNKQEYYKCETGSNVHGIRQAIIPGEGETLVSIDYKGEELRIAANMSAEKVWIDAFANGEDIHTSTAKAVFGPDADKNDRKKAKIINFASMYGANEYSLHDKMGVPISEARLYLQKYNDALRSLTRWKRFINSKAVKGDVFTYFGRPRRMARYFAKDATNNYKAFGYRTSVNTIVQGSAGDILRFVFGKLHMWKLKNPNLVKNFRIVSNVHDEINFSVKDEWLDEFLKIIPALMRLDIKGWPVPLEVDVSMGPNWCRLISYSIKDGIIIPDGELIKAT